MTGAGQKGTALSEAAVREICAQEVGTWNAHGKRILVIVPDHTRTAPIDLVFRILHDLMAAEAKAFDVLIALGTHPPMSDEAINKRLGITQADRAGRYAKTRFYNHHWVDPEQLVSIGTIGESEVAAISGGLM